jgi:colanic acid/amylovoran biosynthesis glycosyltransferase
MKVVYILNVFPKISETFILNEIVQAQNEGVNIGVVAFSGSTEDRIHPDVSKVRDIHYFLPAVKTTSIFDHFYWFVTHPGRYLKTFRLALNRNNGITRKFLFHLHNVRQIKNMNPDHLHAHFGTWTADMAMLTSLLTGIPYTFTTHSYDIFTFPPKNMALKSRLAKKHITISKYNKKYLVDIFNVRPEDVAVVHCGVDFTKIQGKSTVTANKIVTMARLEKTKGLDHLIKSYGRLRDKGVEFEAIIIGEGSKRPNLEKLIVELDLQDRVRLLGNRTQNNIFEILQTCRLMVMTSTVEGIPVSLMEAMAFMIPVIATRITGIPELIDDGHSGFLVEPTDMNGLVEKMERLLTDNDLRRRFVENGYKKVTKEFNLKYEVNLLVEVWKNACERA